jgi:hypothetical protein
MERGSNKKKETKRETQPRPGLNFIYVPAHKAHYYGGAQDDEVDPEERSQTVKFIIAICNSTEFYQINVQNLN